MNWLLNRTAVRFSHVTFTVEAHLDHGESVAVVGNSRSLGDFTVANAVPLVTTPGTFPTWRTKTPVILSTKTPVSYKYVILSGGRPKQWESIEGDREFTPRKRRHTLHDTLGRADDGTAVKPLHRPAGSRPSQRACGVAESASPKPAAALLQRTSGGDDLSPPPLAGEEEDGTTGAAAVAAAGAHDGATGSGGACSELAPFTVPLEEEAGATAGEDAAPSAAGAAGKESAESASKLLEPPPLPQGRLLLVTCPLPVHVTRRRNGEWHAEWSDDHVAARSAVHSIAENMPTMWIGTVPLIREELEEGAEESPDDAVGQLLRGSEEAAGSEEGSERVPFRVRRLTEEEWEPVAALLRSMNCTLVFMSSSLHDAAYRGFCLTTLWPTLHNVLDTEESLSASANARPEVLERWFNAFTQFNALHAETILRAYQPGDTVWVHDYELVLVPRELRARLVDARMAEMARQAAWARERHGVAAAPPSRWDLLALPWNIVFFLHTPFPTSEIFRTLANRNEVLEGMLSADIVGFHVFNYARHFLNACKRCLGLAAQSRKGGNMGIEYNGRNVMITVSHVSVEGELLTSRIRTAGVRAAAERLRKQHEGRIILFGVDKCQRLQGVAHKLLAVEWLLDDYPVWRDRLVLVQRVGLSRSRPQDSVISAHETRTLVERIRQKAPGVVIDYREYDGDVPLEERLALYLAGDVLLQTPTSEGLNRVALEYTFVRAPPRTPGVVVLSEFAAANHALNGCIRVNPFHVSETATALDHALTMPLGERQDRQARDLASLTGLSSSLWTRQVIADVQRTQNADAENRLMAMDGNEDEGTDAPKTHLLAPSSEFSHIDIHQVAAAFRAARKRLLVFNYGGTLVEREGVGLYFKNKFETSSSQRPLHREKLSALNELVRVPNTHVFVISGMDRARMEAKLGAVPLLNLVSESGTRFSWGHCAVLGTGAGAPGDGSVPRKWTNSSQQQRESEVEKALWMDAAQRTMAPYVWRTNGCELLVLDSSVSWDYRDADPQWGGIQAKNLIADLRDALEEMPVMIVRKKGIVEVGPAVSGKGAALREILRAVPDADFTLVVGDDSADESMFTALYAHLSARGETQPPSAGGRSRRRSNVRREEGGGDGGSPRRGNGAGSGDESSPSEVSMSDSDTDAAEDAAPGAFTVTVGMKPSHARAYVNGPSEVWQLINHFRRTGSASATSQAAHLNAARKGGAVPY